MRDLKYLIELYDNKCDWAVQMKDFGSTGTQLKKVLHMPDYYGPIKNEMHLKKQW